MKLTIPELKKKHAITLAVFIFLSLLTWFGGPYLSISNHMPLADVAERLYLIAAYFLVWLFKWMVLDHIPAQKNELSPVQMPSETAKRLQTLQGRFQGALNFLKNTVIVKENKKFNLSGLPWYVLTGPAGVGKTTLLASSGVNFILSRQSRQTDTPVTAGREACDWWVTRDLVFVDVPGHYFTGKEKKTAPNVLWSTLLDLVKTTPVKEQLGGVIIALNLPEIMAKPNGQEMSLLIHDMKKRITELRDAFGAQLSFHFVITKCDLLPGFPEFFGEMGSDELAQLWGFTLPALSAKEKRLDVFALRFNALIKRINKQLLWRLHQERNPNTRPCIKDFPLHLERLKEAVMTLLKALAMPDFCLETCYLTSATQTPVEESVNHIPSASGHLTHQALQIMRAPGMQSRAYFIKQLVAYGFLHSSGKTAIVDPIDYAWRRRAMYAVSIGSIVTATLLLGRDFQQSLEKTYALQHDLAHYQMSIQRSLVSDRLVNALPLLDALRQASGDATGRFTRFSAFLSFYSNKSEQTASVVYGKALQTIVVPETQALLEHYLHSASNKNPVLVYTALKAYLMMTGQENFKANFIANTLGKIASIRLNQEALHQLALHMDAAFSAHLLVIQPDQNLVQDVRKQLINLPGIELAFVILKNNDTNNADSTIDLGTNFGKPPVFVSKEVANRIPNMFTASYFQKIVSEEMNMAAMEALKGNRVLGDIPPAANQPTPDALMSELHDQYIANYIDIWESQLANIQPYTPKNLLQADEMIQNLTNNNSPLLQLLQTIKQNTGFDPVMTSSPKMMALDNLIGDADANQGSLYEVFVDLRQLHLYLQKILNSPDSNKSAFMAASARMRNVTADDPIATVHRLAEKSPEPLKSWLNTIANQSWHFMLAKSSEHIQTTWQTTVLPVYNQHIADHYPFVQNSHEDVSLQQFTDFLGHHGLLANFYLTYLKPFVNDKGEQWVWNTVDNQHLPLSNNALLGLQQAANLQHAFFPEGTNQPSIEFTLQPITMDASLRALTLTVNGEEVAFQRSGKRLPRTFTWPGSRDLHATTISFISPDSPMVSNTEKGDWGLFRLVSRSMDAPNTAQKGL
ncbi:MAG TPA: type VI secretion system membrane subunit TssM, partial [Gammaproteobacteria bacterium]|nr:type VI secretion system membrane subunit TssM [Gammaproteobacteria bacterium]